MGLRFRSIESLLGELKNHGYECIFVEPYVHYNSIDGTAEKVFARLKLRRRFVGMVVKNLLSGFWVAYFFTR